MQLSATIFSTDGLACWRRAWVRSVAPWLLVVLCATAEAVPAATPAGDELERFQRAWQAANRGEHAVFEQLKAGLGGYVLYPYLQYEHYQSRRATVDPAEMAAFLADHDDWAFTAGLRTSWLRTQGQQRRWDAMLQYAPGVADTQVQCYLAQAMAELGQREQALAEARKLWVAGRSQPDACDDLFKWLKQAGGITSELAWSRINSAMEAGNPRFTLYLARYVSVEDQVWVERWQQQDQQRYLRLDQALQWPDLPPARDITRYGLLRLARTDPDRAWQVFQQLDGRFDWGSDLRGELLREIALWSAVAHSPHTPERMRAVPQAAQDDRMMEWWARSGLAAAEWAEVVLSVASMSELTRQTDRWRYWDARARLELGDQDYPMALLDGLSREATYYGFLAADFLQRPYAICAQEPEVNADALMGFQSREPVRRVLELHRAGMKSWSRSEWNLVTKTLQPQDLRLAAALATAQDWPDLAIMALARSGDMKWYDWRFPIAYAALVEEFSTRHRLDPSWVLGLMRSESAMAEDAVSPADARGLMQVLPATAKQLARRHAYPYSGSGQLMQARDNIQFGTAFLRELMDKYNGNAALVSAAYNAGPGAVNRWLKELPQQDMAIWIETLPYHETREYVPRVMAFSTIYDWRREQPVRRISSRVPAIRSDTLAAADGDTTSVVCPGPEFTQVPGS